MWFKIVCCCRIPGLGGTQNQRLKEANPQGIRAMKPLKKLNQGSACTVTPSSAHIRMAIPAHLKGPCLVLVIE
jgi:hypothetical protein